MGVARDKEIDVAVAIVVAPRGAGHEAAAPDASLVGDILEFAVAQVAIESAAGVAGNEEVELAIVVVVGDGHAHAPALAGQASFPGDVAEGAVGFLMIQGDHGVAAGAQAFDRGAVDNDDVQAAIVVAIEKAYAAAGGVDDIARFGGGNVLHGDTELAGNVLENGNRRKSATVGPGFGSV